MQQKRSFLLIWIGQLLSILGSSLSWFALSVWLYQKTGSASQFALVALCTALPQMLVSPFAGVLIDRYPRRWMMAAADSGAALTTLLLAGLFFSGQIQVWHIYLTTAFSAICGAVQAPAYRALVASLMERGQLGRANGMMQLGPGLAEVLAPSIAGVLVLVVGVPGVLLIDLLSFCIGVGTLLAARVDEPRAPVRAEVSMRHWLEELKEGGRALRRDPGMVNFLRYEVLFSFLWKLFAVLAVPMFLGLADAGGLGMVLTIAGVGMVSGSLILSAWGGPRQRLRGLLIFELFSALGFCLMGSVPVVWVVAAAAFLAHFTLAMVSGLSGAIWQSRVDTAVQGRVFSIKQAAVNAATLFSYLIAGALADRVMEPLLRPGGLLVESLGPWFGVGPGRGIALLFFLIGFIKAISVVWVYRSPGVRPLDESLTAESPARS